jgi:parallel beta-helix repeat protein
MRSVHFLAGLAIASVIMATACDRPTAPGGAAAFDPGQRPDVDLAAPLMAYAKQLAAIPVAEALTGSLTFQAGTVHQSREASPTILVDDDGRQCRGALTTIQAAVAAASAGATILVCPGTYHGSVDIVGPSKNGIQLIAQGKGHSARGTAKGDDDEIDDEEIDDEDDARNEGNVVLAGNHTQENGFYLQDVSGVRIQGFTVRDFGVLSSSPTTVGMGNNILLLRAHGNTITRNVLTGSDMMGIWLINSGSNLVEHNVARDNDAKPYGYGLGCGIMLSAPDAAGKALSANNVFRHNVSRGNPLAGIMIGNAGTGTVVSRNVLSRGGRFGLRFWDTENALIERNVISNNRGLFTNPAADQFARGLDLRRSGGSTVRRNIAFGNGGAAGSYDFFWDGVGVVSFDHNRCGTSQPVGLCKRGDD